jgi:DNA-binding LacI/PurR family transcriptional regulator
MALIGFDGLPTASQISPRLTTRHLTTSILLDLIENPSSRSYQMTLPTQLIVRELRGSA